MPLVSGYDSDSDDEGGPSALPKPTGGLSSLLPPPSAKPSTPLPPGLKLPAPRGVDSGNKVSAAPASQKRAPEKRQIKIESLGSLSAEDEGASALKKPKLEAAGSSAKPGLHGLLGMLPAPKERPPQATEKKDSEAGKLNNMGLSETSEGRLQLQAEGSSETKKAKGNNDFRAMLGLKSNGNAPKAKVTASDAPKVLSDPVPVPKARDEPPVASAPEPSREKNTDFFTFSTTASNTSSALPQAKKSFSAAPVVEEETQKEEEGEAAEDEDSYKGWQQGPDGNWFPVTPEAHAAYNAYLSAQGAQAQQQQDRPADMQYGDINSIQSVDANASRAAWLSRPSSEVDASTAGLDRKYALAAASMAMPDQGVPLVDQEEEVKKMDKKTNMRARRKGQLSALIAQAEENREKLEERWSRGKEGRNVAKEKYGF